MKVIKEMIYEVWCLEVENILCQEPCCSRENQGGVDCTDLFKQACEYQKKGDIEQAILCCKKGLANNPKSLKSNFLLGELMRQKGYSLAAKMYFKQVIQLEPKNVPAHFNMGLLSYENGDVKDSLGHFQQASALSGGTEPSIWANLALALKDTGDTKGSVEANLKAIKLDGKFVVAYYNLGNIFCEIQRYNEAISMYSKVLELNPVHTDALFNIAVACQSKGSLAAAMSYYKQYLKYEPRSKEAKDAVKRIEQTLKNGGILNV